MTKEKFDAIIIGSGIGGLSCAASLAMCDYKVLVLEKNLSPGGSMSFFSCTDIAMRQHLPPDILALTVNKPMYRQLCELDINSFLYKSFWKTLRKIRDVPCERPS